MSAFESFESVEELTKAATDKGMYVVDHENLEPLIKEFSTVLPEVDKLCELSDPEGTPYISKYKARDLLDNLANKLEATKTILTLEGKRDVVRDEIEWRMASIR